MVAQNANAVSIVNHQEGIVFFTECHNFGKVCDVTFHGKHTVDDDQLVRVLLAVQDQLKVFHVVVFVFSHIAKAETGTIDDRCVVRAVNNDGFLAAHQRTQHTLVDHEPGGKNQGLFLTHQRGEFFLQLNMDVQGSVEETTAGGACAVFGNGLGGGFFNLGVIGKPQVIVAAQHDDFLALVLNGIFLGRFNHAEKIVGINGH